MGFIESQIAFIKQYGIAYLLGVRTTLMLSLIGVVFGFLLGIIICLMRMSKNKVFSFFGSAYVEIIRGTPMMVQLLLIYFGLRSKIPPSLELLKNQILLCSVAICINAAAYIAELIRGGIESVDKGQFEAGRCLGLSEKQTMKAIIFPQALKNILPSLGNEFIALIKETAIVLNVGVADLTYMGNVIKGTTFEVFRPLMYAAILYFIMTFSLSKLMNKFERRLAND
ncbi:amino acid ABC transporter permease [Anaerosphaera multitolerans]|uniref:Amino acid ABC transporter permease n=1 Tax=Anaerosphaera multitolerans TaxID=2487351 RepID=A0A437S6Q3_9FIRM|nr:amino acid ABC transporter permease [Anaerosphaera multitolerans]RVU54703.1 amino acid ABC transporter permease [Anaerosphaera multitolerans]